MRLLVDTQILIWFQLGDSRLNSEVLNLLTDQKNEIFVSDVSLFEIAIKQTIGKLSELDISIEHIALTADTDGFQILPISRKQLFSYSNTPFFADHRDPFDRLLIAIAKIENLTLVSADDKFNHYTDYVEIIKVN